MYIDVKEGVEKEKKNIYIYIYIYYIYIYIYIHFNFGRGLCGSFPMLFPKASASCGKFW